MPIVTDTDQRKDRVPQLILAFLLLLALAFSVLLARWAWGWAFPAPPTPMRPVAGPVLIIRP